ncbi:MAG: AmmeMemoRadiSam system protein A [Thiohalophilus sp.]|uniref:AmmeMemoRadiSam system protein A n=1 Tax=Thiohalophilus sp. TaxID=3028392 RepID=UPI00286FBC05|nr:AmmeMemoRadiSam system protein A [Thiohalophilus sp.]MDR9436741.1 AmmeMemoRadiSam system protein A [Thiohalophilus sp.]
MDSAQRQQLLAIARQSIHHGLQHGRPLSVNAQDYDESLQQPGASFITLNLHAQLRGCIGSLEAWRPLIVDVAENAYAAAFRDPRFPPVNDIEFPQLEYHISLLNPAEPMQFTSESELLAQLRPHVDGLILEDKGHRGTFLPAVWESLPEPEQFWQHLKLKAGLPADYWSDTLKVSRYTVEEFS